MDKKFRPLVVRPAIEIGHLSTRITALANEGLLFRTRWRFRKVGLVIKPHPAYWWMRAYAMVPTLQAINGSIIRVYFSGRDDQNRSHIGYAVIDLDRVEADPSGAVVELSMEPVLSI